MYRLLIRPLLFLFDPEKIHHFTFKAIVILQRIPGVAQLFRWMYSREDQRLSRQVFGIHFPNPVGLAAGFDKDALATDEFANFGFGFIEIGTVTPKPQAGNDQPRLFRLPKDKAIINRMGFNNQGAAAAAQRLSNRKSKIIIGGNIGKNKVTPNELAFEDYKECYRILDPVVDYFVVNVSSPNTPGLRELQEKEPLRQLLSGVKSLSANSPKPKPVLLKIAPDLTEQQLEDIVDILLSTKTDGVIATNTTVDRSKLTTETTTIQAIGAGGLSGAPLKDRSTEVIRWLRQKLGPDYPIIGVGGILTAADAREKFKAGATLIQLYTGFIYEGPGLVKKILKSV
ncbi:MAG: quinone-dependent dihydroorotate dehydrogenase [Cyclobacteriaceae bacterium]